MRTWTTGAAAYVDGLALKRQMEPGKCFTRWMDHKPVIVRLCLPKLRRANLFCAPQWPYAREAVRWSAQTDDGSCEQCRTGVEAAVEGKLSGMSEANAWELSEDAARESAAANWPSNAGIRDDSAEARHGERRAELWARVDALTTY